MEHGTGDRHESADVAFNNTSGVMTTGKNVTDRLMLVGTVLVEGVAQEVFAFVSDISLGNSAMFKAEAFKGFFTSNGVDDRDTRFKVNINETRGGINKDQTTSELLVSRFLAVGFKAAARRVADKMVSKHATAGEESFLFGDVLEVFVGAEDRARLGLAALLGILTGSTERTRGEAGRGALNATRGFSVSQQTILHEPLHLASMDVSKLLMPAEDLLLSFS